MTRTADRRGFTLVELLVAMAIIVALASMALLVVPAALDQDRTTDAAASVRQWLMIAKSRAARDNLPRGVRLIVDATKPVANQLLVTDLQYTEAPPVMIPKLMDPNNPNNSIPPGDPRSPQVVFTYTADGTGTVTTRQCRIINLDATTDAELRAASNITPVVLALPLLTPAPDGGKYTFLQVVGYYPNGDSSRNPPLPAGGVDLSYYPDVPLGAAGDASGTPTYVTYHFGIYATPRPLLGEPTLPLPRDICVDLNQNVSSPSGTVGTDYDIVFAPSGQVMPFGVAATGRVGRIQLWVRNSRKAPFIKGVVRPNQAPVYHTSTSLPNGPNLPFGNAGEQLLVSVKTKSGALGVFKVRWPDNEASGRYNRIPGSRPARFFDPYYFTYQGADEGL